MSDLSVKYKEDLDRVQSHVNSLGEHFDSVLILCTKFEEGHTVKIAKGSGNWYARYGQVREWVIGEEELMRQDSRNESADGQA